MAVIKFTPNFLSGSTVSVQGYMVNLSNGSYNTIYTNGGALNPEIGFFSGGNFRTYSSSQPASVGLFRIMSGTKPTNIETLTSTTPPVGTSVLWQSYAPNWNNNNWAPTGNNWYTNPTVLSSIFVAASATGIASWFWICTAIAYRVTEGAQTFPDPSPVYHNIIGDIGLVGSGADMEMVNTTITADQLVRVLNVSIGISTDFT